MKKIFQQSGFTIIEAMVAISVLAILGLIISDLLSKGFQGNNKTLITGNVKQNGQVLLNILDQNIRTAESIVCVGKYPATLPSGINNTIVILKNGQYTRFRFIDPTTNANGYATQDTPVPPVDPSDIASYSAYCSDAGLISPVTLTDNNKIDGVSVKNGNFTRLASPGSKDSIMINFTVTTAVNASQAFQNQVQDTDYQSTIQLR